MDKEAILDLIKNWGYYPLPKSHADSPGYTGVLIAIRKQPTGKHYDPERLHLRLRDAEGHYEWRTSSWQLPLTSSDHLCPGLVTLHDRNDKRVHFFTFGGSLEVILEPDVIVHAIHSPAPILEVTSREETFADHLASEAEALLGEIEEQLEELGEAEAERRQAPVDPFQLYVAALQSIFQRYEHVPALQKTYHEFYDALHREKAWLTAKGLWPGKPLSSEDLLRRCLIGT